MTHWNYRRMRVKDGDDFIYAIHEVYYDENNVVTGWSSTPSSVISDTPDFSKVMAMIGRCLEELVLDFESGEEVK